ncbi:MAG: tetratricopeptide repeat protein, partial [Planctomycetes bacterium]|nr:tetratricopeptide repeat protein [Planctomycetota bacterium]
MTRDDVLTFLLDAWPLLATPRADANRSHLEVTLDGLPPGHDAAADVELSAVRAPQGAPPPLAARLARIPPATVQRLVAVADELLATAPPGIPVSLVACLLAWLDARGLLSARARAIAEAQRAADPRDTLALLLRLDLLPRDRLAAAWELSLAPAPSPSPAAAGEGRGEGTSALPSAPAPALDRSSGADSLTELKPLDPARYRLQSELGRGGMGVVYKAWDRDLARSVALKSLLLDRAIEPSDLARFHKEALACARLRHPHIVQLHDVGLWQGCPSLVMDYVDGPTLKAWIAAVDPAAPDTWSRAAALLRQAVEAVAYAHRQGIVHRDIKPENILLDRDGNAYLTDYGLAREMGSRTRLTQTGAVMGTPAFMSPEQANGAADASAAATDIYALGAVLYNLLTRRPPFEGATVPSILYQVINVDPPRPRELDPRVPPDLETVCRKAMEKEPALRYPSADELAAELGRFLAGEPVRAVPPGFSTLFVRRVRRHPRTSATVVAGVLTLAAALAWAGQAATRAALEQTRREQAEALEAARRAVREETARRLARARLAHGEEAIALYGEALASEPTSVEALLGRARAAADLGRFADACADCDRAVVAGREPPAALYLRARLLRDHLGRRADAARDFARLAEVDAEHETGLLGLALLRDEEGKPAEALALLDQAATRNPQNPEPVLAAARIRLAAGEHALALRAVDAAIRLRPEAADPYLLRARIQLAAGDRAAALSDANHLLELTPQNVEGRLLRADLRAATGDVDAALGDLGRVVAARPDDAAPRLARARLHRERGDYHAALADLDEVVRRAPADRARRVERADLLFRAGRYREAREAWNELLADGSGSGTEHIWRSLVRLHLGDQAGFLQDLTVVSKMRDLPSEDVVIATAAAAREQGRLEVAEMLLASVVRWVPTNLRAPVELGRLLGERGNWPAAVTYFTKAVRARERHGSPAAEVREARAGRLEEAAATAAAVLAEDADDGRARTARALALAGSGRAAEALAALEGGRSAYPVLPWAAAVRAEALRRLGEERAAARWVATALSGDPALAPAYVCRAELRAAAGDRAGAAADLACAAELEPVMAPGLAARRAELASALAASPSPAAPPSTSAPALSPSPAAPPSASAPALSPSLAAAGEGRGEGLSAPPSAPATPLAGHLLRAQAHLAAGQPLCARDDLEAAIDRVPPAYEARLLLADLYRSAFQDPGKALSLYDELLRLRWRRAALHIGRARAWIDLRQRSNAISELGKALVLDPGSAAAYGLRGGLYLEAGLLDRAAKDLDIAVMHWEKQRAAAASSPAAAPTASAPAASPSPAAAPIASASAPSPSPAAAPSATASASSPSPAAAPSASA